METFHPKKSSLLLLSFFQLKNIATDFERFSSSVSSSNLYSFYNKILLAQKEVLVKHEQLTPLFKSFPLEKLSGKKTKFSLSETQVEELFVKFGLSEQITLPSKQFHQLKEDVVSGAREAFNLLEKHLNKQFRQVLEEANWPSTSAARNLALNSKLKFLFQSFASDLILLQFSVLEGVEMNLEEGKSIIFAQQSNLKHLRPVDIMLNFIGLRFSFNFEADKQTNRIDKPEWFFSFISGMIRDHLPLLLVHLQPVMDYRNKVKTDVYFLLDVDEMIADEEKEEDKLARKIGHMRAETVLKGRSKGEIMELESEKRKLLNHYVDEMIGFESLLREVYDYPPSSLFHDTFSKSEMDVTCMGIFSHQKLFEKWIVVEQQLCKEAVLKLVSDKQAWGFQFEETEEHRPSKAVFLFVSLLERNTERSRYLQDISQRLKFLETIQIPIISQFEEEVRYAAGDQGNISRPSEYAFICILANSTNYLLQVLSDWSNDWFFVELQDFKKNGLHKSSLEQVHVRGSVFDEVIGNLVRVKKNMIKKIVEALVEAFHRASASYFKGRVWKNENEDQLLSSSGGEPDETDIGMKMCDLSGELCDGLSILKDKIFVVKESLASSLLQKFWRKLANQLNSLIFKEIFEQHQFTYLGACQLGLDMHVMFSIFHTFTPHPENFFKDVKEMITVLMMPIGQLKEIYQTFSEKQNSKDRKDILSRYGIFKLSSSQIIAIMGQRMDLYSTSFASYSKSNQPK